MLGNLHKPVTIAHGKITLLYDEVVKKTLEKEGADYVVEKMALDSPMQYLNLSAHSHHHHD